VSIRTTSVPRDSAAASASKTTEAASWPVSALTMSQPALGPGRELLDGRGAVGVGGGDHDVEPGVLLQVPGELADGCRLAGPVDADDEHHGGPRAKIDARPAACGEVGEQLNEAVPDRLRALDAAGLHLALEAPDDLRGGLGADVGHDQRLLEALPGLGVDRLEEAGAELRAQCLAAGCEALAQPFEQAAASGRVSVLRGGFFDGALAVAQIEQLSPGGRHRPGSLEARWSQAACSPEPAPSAAESLCSRGSLREMTLVAPSCIETP
jgi:hypothetical protein